MSVEDMNGMVNDLDDRADFYDDHHLNQFGVTKAMPVLLAWLREHKLLP